MTVEGAAAQTQQAPPPQEAPKQKGTLPKGMEQGQTQNTQSPPPQQTSSNDGKSRKQEREEYEAEYLKRIEEEKAAEEKARQEALAAEAQAKAQSNRGSLPKGFEPTVESKPEPAKQKGTLPKGF